MPVYKVYSIQHTVITQLTLLSREQSRTLEHLELQDMQTSCKQYFDFKYEYKYEFGLQLALSSLHCFLCNCMSTIFLLSF